MKNEIEKLYHEAQKELEKAKDIKQVEDIEIKYLGRKGELTKILRSLSELSENERRTLGSQANELKDELEQLISEKKKILQAKAFQNIAKNEKDDITIPAKKRVGHHHPISIVKRELEDLFSSMGFIIEDGPELESDYYNFEALNIPPHHPARDIQDTFYIADNPELVLRTHTSPVQVRAMEKYGAPLRVVVPGRVFRYEATDASHENTFDQVEGLMIDEEVSISHLVAVMKELLQGIFKREVEVRLRPGYFPFVEPGFELDVNCQICAGRGCSVCKHTGWVEILPCGLVHPRVLEYGGIDPKKFTGFAFGLGLTRLAMMKYGIDDIRHFLSGDLRFLNQF